MYLFISTAVIVTFNKRPDPLFDYLKGLDYKILIIFFLLLSIFLTTLIFVSANLRAQKANSIGRIPQFLKTYYKYYRTLPLFIIGIGFLLMTIFVTNPFGLALILLGILLFVIMSMIKNNCECLKEWEVRFQRFRRKHDC